ncbi:MAG: hypothetical protein AMJ70_02255 [Dehalococcoidia bacterium SG8_51_3]|nr:MAG: hypothetical protein AMJ70_02255 [Dehalococcoidia bacterium SG8_51_3]
METNSSYQEHDIALQARIRYISRLLTKIEIANIARVTEEDVDLFERNQVMNPIAKRRLLNAYILKNTLNQYLFDRFYQS